MRRKLILAMAVSTIAMSGCASKYQKIETTTVAETVQESTETETVTEEVTEESSQEEILATTVAETETKHEETNKETTAKAETVAKIETAAEKTQKTTTAAAETPQLLGKGDSTDDPERDAKEEIENYYIGNHTRSYDGSELTIEKTGDWKFNVDLSIVGLCFLDGGVGTYDTHKINVQFDDPNGNKMSAVIYRDGDNNLAVRITDSSWDYLPDGEILDGFGK